MLIENFADLLNAKRVGPTKWKALCPCHRDRNESLEISVGHTQPIVVICRACGAKVADVAQAMGLRVSALCRDRPDNGHFTRSSGRADLPRLDIAAEASVVRKDAMVLTLLAEKVRQRQVLTDDEAARLDLLITQMDGVIERAGGGQMPDEIIRLHGRTPRGNA